ncbi:hypothetical protein H1O16_gp392 [Burkholderia phage BcepSaruman]|uniref:Uncharacterized protein n=1 Tax=Burkholderia phage BcepSaruman TaxID=2530032 RepID=A0A4D5ZCM9_9CAUD|nr:hypothetical protein H1O16_gp392 [Burkholderia phage BcepSaruman]QBX06805.1 hypothetical protein BcepSaruman_392 [Burkholderia phage BcepSaruman]
MTPTHDEIRSAARTLLQGARERFEEGRSQYICAAISVVKDNHVAAARSALLRGCLSATECNHVIDVMNAARDALHNRILLELQGYTSLTSWVLNNGHLPRGLRARELMDPMRATRLAWINFMLENWV